MRCETRDGAESKSTIVKYCDLEDLPMHDKCGGSCCFVHIAHCIAKGINCMEILRYGFLILFLLDPRTAIVSNSSLLRAFMLRLRKPSLLTCKFGMSPQCVLFWCRQTGSIGGLLLTIMIWTIEVAVLCLLIRTAEKYKTKSFQVNFFFLECLMYMLTGDNSTSFSLNPMYRANERAQLILRCEGHKPLSVY